jgi:hypothetical protein
VNHLRDGRKFDVRLACNVCGSITHRVITEYEPMPKFSIKCVGKLERGIRRRCRGNMVVQLVSSRYDPERVALSTDSANLKKGLAIAVNERNDFAKQVKDLTIANENKEEIIARMITNSPRYKALYEECKKDRESVMGENKRLREKIKYYIGLNRG